LFDLKCIGSIYSRFADEDFKPNQDSDDDEETIEKEEQDLDVVLYVSIYLIVLVNLYSTTHSATIIRALVVLPVQRDPKKIRLS